MATKGCSLDASRVASSKGWAFSMWSHIFEKVSITDEQRKHVKTHESFCSNQPSPASFGVAINDRIALFSAINVFRVFSFFFWVFCVILGELSSDDLSLLPLLGPKSTSKSSSSLNSLLGLKHFYDNQDSLVLHGTIWY